MPLLIPMDVYSIGWRHEVHLPENLCTITLHGMYLLHHHHFSSSSSSSSFVALRYTYKNYKNIGGKNICEGNVGMVLNMMYGF